MREKYGDFSKDLATFVFQMDNNSLLLQNWGISTLNIQHEVTKWTTDIFAATLQSGIVGCVDDIDHHGLSANLWIVTGP